ncbi:MAG: hypothetical protein JXX28_13750 [Deltaproteobacteria bacterium]|nr:hypothetical protein [Deltaproteobacteria bacterium]
MSAEPRALRRALLPIEQRAAELPWAHERRWRAQTHAWVEGGVTVLDLHDLSVKLGLEAVDLALTVEHAAGGLTLITGRGKHSGGRSPLREAVLTHLAEQGVPHYAARPGRVEVVWDEGARSRARGGLGCLFWLTVAALIAGAALGLG